MNSSKLFPEVSIIILNTSNSSLDDMMATLKRQIETGQRPYIVHLTQETLRMAPNVQGFLKTFIEEQIEKCRIIVEESQRLRKYNQLDQWMEEIEIRKGKKKEKKRSSSGIKDGIRNQLSMKRDCAQNIVIDFPIEHEAIKLYLVLFDVYDSEMIMALLSFDSSLKTIVNLFPRIVHNEAVALIKSEGFWSDLLKEKFKKAFNDVAFLDLDVPIESRYILNLRSKLIYDQFSYFFYDIEDIKSNYKSFLNRLEIVDVNVDVAIEDCVEMKRRLDKIPESMLTVKVIYDAILDQVASTNGSRKSSLNAMLKRPLQVEFLGKKFSDFNDKWHGAYEQNPKFYGKQIEKLENSLHMWENVESISLEKRQLLNYFMTKLVNILGDFHYLEFYIYALQFKTMKKSKKEFTRTKNFYENRSVGRESSTQKFMKPTLSDSNVEYKNQSKIPEEISQLVEVTTKLHRTQIAGENVIVMMFSSSAMLQHLTLLMSFYKSYSRQHFQLLDVTLIKFHKQPIPQMFMTKTFEKVLPTPLCFRDFSDYIEQESKVVMKENEFSQGNATSVRVNPQDFILKSSLKGMKAEPLDGMLENISFTHSFVNDKKSVEKDICVYNVSNRLIQFHVTESKFNSVHLTVNTSNFDWLNQQRDLNYCCKLHDVLLSISFDLKQNELQLLTLTSNNGMRISLERNFNISSEKQKFLNQWNISLSFPAGVAIKNVDNGAVEQCWLDGKSPDGERKRVLFPNGFVMIMFEDGAGKLFAPNGSIFEVNGKTRKSSMGIMKSQKGSHDKEATRLHQDTITSIHFLKDFINLTSFKMILPNGETFNVEHDIIVDKLESIDSMEKFCKLNGSLLITRNDGLKVIHTNAYTKCLFPDGTLITTWLRDDFITDPFFDETELKQSILEDIWSSESNNESKLIVKTIFNRITDDYLININSTHQIEHKNYGAVHFDDEKINFHMFNGMKLEAHFGKFLMALPNGVTFKINDSQMRFMSEVCSECFRCRASENLIKFLFYALFLLLLLTD